MSSLTMRRSSEQGACGRSASGVSRRSLELIALATLSLGLAGGCGTLPARQSVQSASMQSPPVAGMTAPAAPDIAPAARFAAQPAPTATFMPAAACVAGESAWTRETLYFGRGLPGGGTVSDAQWGEFVATTLAALFPDGFTVIAADGQWRGADGAVVREPSQVVILLHSGDVLSDAAVGVAVEEYKRRFRQEAVLRERSRVCVRF
jgi:hypothetical protein